MTSQPQDILRTLTIGGQFAGQLCSLPALEAPGFGLMPRLPHSLCVLL